MLKSITYVTTFPFHSILDFAYPAFQFYNENSSKSNNWQMVIPDLIQKLSYSKVLILLLQGSSIFSTSSSSSFSSSVLFPFLPHPHHLLFSYPFKNEIFPVSFFYLQHSPEQERFGGKAEKQMEKKKKNCNHEKNLKNSFKWFVSRGGKEGWKK